MNGRRSPEFFIAPGARKELDEAGHSGAFPGLTEVPAPKLGPQAAIIGMRADAPGRIVPGTRSEYTCSYCAERVRLAPSGQRCAEEGSRVVCIECLPRWAES